MYDIEIYRWDTLAWKHKLAYTGEFEYINRYSPVPGRVWYVFKPTSLTKDELQDAGFWNIESPGFTITNSGNVRFRVESLNKSWKLIDVGLPPRKTISE